MSTGVQTDHTHKKPHAAPTDTPHRQMKDDPQEKQNVNEGRIEQGGASHTQGEGVDERNRYPRAPGDHAKSGT